MKFFRSRENEPVVSAFWWVFALGSTLLSNACLSTSPPGSRRSASPESLQRGVLETEDSGDLLPGLSFDWNQAERDCASSQDFSRQVSVRLAGRDANWFPSLLERSLQVRVAVEKKALAWEGTLRLKGEIEAKRVVVGSACSEVVTALALITALRLRELPVVESPEEEAEANEPVKPLPVPEVTTLALEETSRTASVGEGDPDKGQEMVTRLVLLGGYLTVPVPSFDLSVRADLRASSSFGTWVWSGALAYQRGDKDRFSIQGALAEIGLCSASFADELWVRACGFARGGAHYVVASETERGATSPSTLPWAALGAGLHVDFPLQGKLNVRSFAEAFAGIVQNEYFVAGVGEDGVIAAENVASLTPSRIGVRLGIGLSYDL